MLKSWSSYVLLTAIVIGAATVTPAADHSQAAVRDHSEQESIYRTFLTGRRAVRGPVRREQAASVDYIPVSPAVVNLEVSADTASGRFRQEYPVPGRFSSGTFQVCWLDDQFGPPSLIGRRFAADLAPLGNAFPVFTDDVEREPVTLGGASDGTRLLVTWLGLSLPHVYAVHLDQAGNAGTEYVVDQGFNPQFLGAPAAGRRYPGGHMVVWEEFRSGWHIFGQAFDAAGFSAGLNINIDERPDSLLKITPAVAGDTAGGFLVAWSEGDSSRCDVYVRIFDAADTAITTAIQLTAPTGSESYMLPDVAYLPGADEYWVMYLLTDSPADSTQLFVRRVSRTGTLLGSAAALVAGPYPWTPHQAVWSDRVAVYTARYDNLSEIRSLELNSSVQIIDSSEVINSATVRERGRPFAAASADSALVVWQDAESGEWDGRGRLRSGGGNTSSDELLSMEGPGGHQRSPAAFARAAGGVFVCFTDQQLDDGDISLVDVEESGAISLRRIVNDDGTLERQSDVHAAADTNGRALITWTDERGDWAGPATHAAGRFMLNGSFTGASFAIPADIAAGFQAETDVAMSPGGQAAAVWVDNRSGIVRAYVRIFDEADAAVTGDILLFDGSQSQVFVDREEAPVVSTDAVGSFWTAWSIHDVATDSFFVLAQAWDSAGNRIGSNADISPVGATGSPLAMSVAALGPSLVRVVWVDPTSGNEGVWTAVYDTLGAQQGPPALVSGSGAVTWDPDVSIDGASGRWAIIWSQRGGLYEHVLWQRFDSDGTPTTGIQQVSSATDATRRRDPFVAFSGTYIYGIWHDNEVAGQGYDVRLTSILKASAAVGEDGVIRPSRLSLQQNYPNPFNPETVIEYTLAAPAYVKLHVFDVLGRRVRTLVESPQPAGSHRRVWDGTDQAGRPVATGVYFYRLDTGSERVARRMVLLR